MPSYAALTCMRVRVDRGVAFVTFDHAPINILDTAMAMELSALAEQLEQDDAVRVVVFASANPDYFLSHADLRLLQQLRDRGFYDSDGMPFFTALLERFRRMPKATIAMLEGRARGGGAEFALAMDMSFGAIDRAFLSQMEIVLGILPGAGGAQYLARKLGRSRAMEICLSGTDFSAIDAERYGYINRALPATEIRPFVEQLAYLIASYPARSIALNKAAVNLNEDERAADLITNGKLFSELIKQPEFDARIGKFLGSGGETAAGELTDPGCWAKQLA